MRKGNTIFITITMGVRKRIVAVKVREKRAEGEIRLQNIFYTERKGKARKLLYGGKIGKILLNQSTSNRELEERKKNNVENATHYNTI